MRKKMALSVVAIAMAMLLSFGAAIDQAQADAILFPWIVKSGAISTIVSVVNTAGVPIGFFGQPETHWTYFYKNPNNDQTTRCTEHNFKMDTSQFDIVTVDTSGNINGGDPMFGDVNNATGVPQASLPAAGDRRAFLIVDNNTPAISITGNNIDGTLYGEAMVLELSTGAAWGYVAYNSGGPFGDTPFGPGSQNGFVSFSNQLDPHGEIIGANYVYTDNAPPLLDTAVFATGELAPTVLFPPAVANIRVFTTPVDDILANAVWPAPVDTQWANRGQRFGNLNARVGLCAIPGIVAGPVIDGTCVYPGITLNDETPISTTILKNIVCTAADPIASYLDPATQTQWNVSGSQAWTNFWTRMGNATPAADFRYTPNVMIGRLDWVDGGTTIDGTAVGGTYNNFIQPRSNLWTLVGVFPFGINNFVYSP